MDEHKAIQGLKQGDLSGLEALVQRYQVEAIRTAYAIVREQSMAEDVVQSTFVRLPERIHQYDNHRPFAPWFFRIVARDALMVLRRERRAVPLDLGDPTDSGWLDRVAAETPSPEMLLEQIEAGNAIWDALGSLSPEQRAVIILRYYSDLKHKEIAQRLNIPPGTVRWRLHAALRHLRRWFRHGGWGHHRDGVGNAIQEKVR